MPFDLPEPLLLEAERLLGAELPQSYRQAMLQSNGGELLVAEDAWQQYPIADTSDRKRLSRSANHILKETEVCRGWPRFPEGAIAIAGNGTGDQLLFLRGEQGFEPQVYLWSHDEATLKKVADDFAELHGL